MNSNTSSIVTIVLAILATTLLNFVIFRSKSRQSSSNVDETQQYLTNAVNQALLNAQQALQQSTEDRLSTTQQAIALQNDTASQTIQAIVNPLKESLKALDGKVRDLETARATAYTSLNQQVTDTQTLLTTLKHETTTLSHALRRNDTRGRWGELQVRRILEMLNMKEHVNFVEQKQELGDGTGKPDFTIFLPGSRVLYIDSKAPMGAYLDALEESDLNRRKEKFAAHAKAMKDHVATLAKRNYTSSNESLSYVIMFIPTESSLASACEEIPTLIEDSAKLNVVLTSPTALVAVLSNIAMLWQHVNQEKNAEEIAQRASEMHKRLRTFIQHFDAVGKAITQSVTHFNKAVGSFDDRVMPQAKRVAELGNFAEELPDVTAIDATPKDSKYVTALEAVPDIDVS